MTNETAIKLKIQKLSKKWYVGRTVYAYNEAYEVELKGKIEKLVPSPYIGDNRIMAYVVGTYPENHRLAGLTFSDYWQVS